MKILEPILKAKKLSAAQQIAGALMVERLMFNSARDQAEGYTGGMWDDVPLSRGRYVAKLPGEGDVRVVSNMNHCDVTTTRESAGAAFSLLAVNWACNYFYEKGQMELSGFLSDYFYKLRDSVLASKLLDVPSILSIID